MLSSGATNTLAEADRTLKELRRGIEGLPEMVGPDTPFRNDATMALRAISTPPAPSVDLAEFLQRAIPTRCSPDESLPKNTTKRPPPNPKRRGLRDPGHPRGRMPSQTQHGVDPQLPVVSEFTGRPSAPSPNPARPPSASASFRCLRTS